MPSVKITYFDLLGRGEPLRLACVLGDIQFEDDRIGFQDWAKIKPTTPYGHVPLAEIDGELAVQSGAILRYLGKVTGLYPSDARQALKVDEVVDTVEDIIHCVFYRYTAKDKEGLQKDREKFVNEDIPNYVGGLEKRLKAMGHVGPYVVGEKVTIADLVILNIVIAFKSGVEYVPTDVLDSYKLLMQSYEATMGIPKITEWYRKHPVPNVEV